LGVGIQAGCRTDWDPIAGEKNIKYAACTGSRTVQKCGGCKTTFTKCYLQSHTTNHNRVAKSGGKKKEPQILKGLGVTFPYIGKKNGKEEAGGGKG